MQDYDHDQLIQFAGEWFDNKIDVIDMVLENTEEKQLSLSWHLTESEKRLPTIQLIVQIINMRFKN